MNIYVAQNSGFCFGVKRALKKTLDAVKQEKNHIFTFGPLIHNKQAIQKLNGLGVKSIEDIQEAKDSTLIIRSHGIPISIYDEAKKNNIEIIDATCPFVRRVQEIAKKYYNMDYKIVIIGNPAHPEVIGINGWCNNSAYIIEEISQVEKLPFIDKMCVVAQTTITLEKWDSIIKELDGKANELRQFNTICLATKERQEACADIAKKVDIMIVIGGYHSSNTQKLFKISKDYCPNSIHIETAEDLSCGLFSGCKNIGITAGASTPEWIINDIIKKIENKGGDRIMNNNGNDFNELLQKEDKIFTVPRRGNVLKGKVVQVVDEGIVVNIGYKSDGIIPLNEFSNNSDIHPKDVVKEGDEVDVFVLKSDDGEGNVVLSKKRVDALKDWDIINEAHNNDKTINIKTGEPVKGGIIAYFNELRGFIPASQLSNEYVESLDEYSNKELEVRVIEVDKRKNKAVFSRRKIIEEIIEEKKAQLWSTLEKDIVMEGEVKRIADFGAFVDLGGVDGLIHISEMSWGRIKHPSEVLKIGDIVQVYIKDFDKEKNRISLSLKQAMENPWEKINEKYNKEDIFDGKVVKLVTFGAFVELEPGVEGLVHISQISKDRVAKTSDVLEEGQAVKVKVLDIKKEEKKLSLSIKEAEISEDDQDYEFDYELEEEEKTTIGDILKFKED